MRPVAIDQNAAAFVLRAEAPWGGEVLVRPLKAADRQILGAYFLGLSEATVAKYRPHKFDQETANALCDQIANDPAVRFLALVEQDGNEQVLAYFILLFDLIPSDKARYAEQRGMVLDPATDCQLAPSVADAYQDKGLGSIMLAHLMDVARRVGRKRMVLFGGVRQANKRAIRFYEKFGFRIIGEFLSKAPSFDMYTEL